MSVHRTRLVLLSIFGLVLAGVLGATGLRADDEPSPEPVAGIKNVMNAVNHEEHGFYGLMRAFVDGNPSKGDAGWMLQLHRSAIIAEAGNVLMGLTPPKGAADAAGMKRWRQHAADFREAAKDLKRPLATRNVEKTKAALDVLYKRCEACHADHRPE